MKITGEQDEVYNVIKEMKEKKKKKKKKKKPCYR